MPEAAWLNYERGVTIPGDLLLEFIDLSRTDPHWLLTGEGNVRRHGDSGEAPAAGPCRGRSAAVTCARTRLDDRAGTPSRGQTAIGSKTPCDAPDGR
jgi:hypothetical protein